jgi:hypothetical protein
MVQTIGADDWFGGFVDLTGHHDLIGFAGRVCCYFFEHSCSGYGLVRGVNTNKCKSINKLITIRARRMFIS